MRKQEYATEKGVDNRGPTACYNPGMSERSKKRFAVALWGALVLLSAVYVTGYFAMSKVTQYIEPGVIREFDSRGLCHMYFPLAWIEFQITRRHVFLCHTIGEPYERQTVHAFIAPPPN